MRKPKTVVGQAALAFIRKNKWVTPDELCEYLAAEGIQVEGEHKLSVPGDMVVKEGVSIWVQTGMRELHHLGLVSHRGSINAGKLLTGYIYLKPGDGL